METLQRERKMEPDRGEVFLQTKAGVNTFPLFLHGLGFRHGEALHGVVLLPAQVLLVGRRPGFAVNVRVD